MYEKKQWLTDLKLISFNTCDTVEILIKILAKHKNYTADLVYFIEVVKITEYWFHQYIVRNTVPQLKDGCESSLVKYLILSTGDLQIQITELLMSAFMS